MLYRCWSSVYYAIWIFRCHKLEAWNSIALRVKVLEIHPNNDSI